LIRNSQLTNPIKNSVQRND